ncbi:hypothetical protein [Streptomyces sp. gCLA4]|uniref:hypothetical protein n=1 Tax=Streptomyces sp. gCLA4 TaxID=1873416 RepID=UPI0015FF1D88|nr:hypothetical protein [Streptomyces sp. gCLA4]
MADPKIPTPRECGGALWWLLRYAHHVVFVDGAEVKNGKGKVVEDSTRSTRVGVAAFIVFLLLIFGRRYPNLWLWAGGLLLLIVFGLAATGDFTTEPDDQEDEDDQEPGEEHEDEVQEPKGEQAVKLSPEEAQILLYDRLREAIGTGNGIHLDALLSRAKKEGWAGEDWDTATLRAYLLERGVEVKNQLKVRGVNLPGVPHSTIPDHHTPLPSPGTSHIRLLRKAEGG